MEKRGVTRDKGGTLLSFALSILLAAAAAAALILATALLMDRLSLGESTLKKMVYAIYFISAFACGFVMGKRKKERKFFWGLLAGGGWFALIFLGSLIVHGASLETGAVAGVLAACAGGSMLGGMFS